MTSNADWVVPAGDGGIRRWYVVETAATGVITKDEWLKLYQWYENGGQEALMYEMLNRDIEVITLFNAKEAPAKTKALEEQMRHSLNDIEKFVLGIIENSYYQSYERGEILTHYIKDDEQVISAKDIFEAFKSDKSNNVYRLNAKSFGKAVKKILEYSTVRRALGNHYVFHTRKLCSDNFYKNVGVEPELHENELKWVKKPHNFEENKLTKAEKNELLGDKKPKKWDKNTK